MTVREGNVLWVDGLRGVASVIVVFTHINRAFDPGLFLAANDEYGNIPRIIQYPIIRILVQGRIGVSIFSLVTGYVCALKPIRQIRAGHPEQCFSTIARSAFRRVPRLVLPTTIVTVLIWLLAEIGTFRVSKASDSPWIVDTSPNREPGFGSAILLLIHNIISTWTRGDNYYDVHQWTLLPLLKGSMLVYMTMVGTAYVKARYRMMIEMALFLYYYVSNDSAFGMQFFFGVFLSELSQHPPHLSWLAARKWPSRYLAPFLIILGLYVASFPEGSADQVDVMPWSRQLHEISYRIFPDGNDTPRFYTGIGLEFISLGIHFSSAAKNLLSNKYFLWFGKNSFAVYLIHGTLLRSVLIWMMEGITIPPEVQNEEGHMVPGRLSMPGKPRYYFMLGLWFIIVYAAANVWTKYVDPFCARLAVKFEKYVFEEQESLSHTNGAARVEDSEKRILP